MKIRKPYERTRFKQHIGEGSHVQQNLRQETDVNFIMAKYKKTGALSHVMSTAGQYGDFSDVPDYKAGLERVMAADTMFMQLPAKIRDRFSNDPANFIEFATNPENLGELRSLGLAPPEKDPQPSTVKEPVPAPAKPDPKPDPGATS